MRDIVIIGRLLIAVLSASASFSQTNNARLEGTVQDQSAAVIPNATVTAVNTQTQARTSVRSNPEGAFVIPTLQPGLYTVTVDAAGFRKAVLNNVELNVAATVSQIVKLEIGQTTESVVVEANQTRVQTTDSQISRAVTLKDIDTLPQLGRNPITLAVFQPGVQIDVRAGQDASFSHVNGLRQGSNNSTLDGIDVNDSTAPRLGLSLTSNNTDSVEEFRVVTQGGKAEYGRSAGAQVELITRSGTNQYHGSAFDYLRNTALNANDFFNNQSGGAVPKYIRNIYGGSFGGPIRRDKTFIFGNFRGTRTRQEQVRNRTVPTPEAISGIFRYRANGASQSYNFAAADPRGIGVDKEVAKIFAQYPKPNNFDLGDGLNSAGFRFNNPVPSFEDQFTIKGDHHLTSNHAIFLRWSWQRSSSIDNLNNADATFPGQVQGTQGGHRWGFSAGSDWTITPTLVNEFRAGHQSSTTDFLRPNRLKGPTYITNLFTDINYSPFSQGRNSPVNDFTDNLTKVYRNHTFKGGANIRLTTQFGYNEANIYPNVTTAVANGNNVPANIGPAGLSSSDRQTFEQLYNDVLGRIDQVTQTFYSDLEKFQPAGTARVRNYILRESGYFFQDDWKIRRNLTLNLGLRYELFGVPHESNGFQGTLVKANLVNGVNQVTDLTVRRSTAPYQQDWNNFAPRFGFAWDIRGDGKTAVRGNYGIFYDRQIGSVVNGVDGGTPGFSQPVPVFPNQTGTDRRLADGVPLPVQPGAPILQLPATRSSSIIIFNPNLRTGYVHSYSLTVQHEVFRNTVLEAGYVGNRGVKLFTDRDLNQPRIYGDFLQSFKEIQTFQNNGAAPPGGNVFVKLYGSAAAAVTALGATNFQRGLVGTVANAVDRNATNFNRFAAAGLPATYLRNYPQYNQVIVGTNDGRSYYDSLQVSLRRSAGALRFSANYTFSKSMDNNSNEGNGFASSTPIDSFNFRLSRALADFDRPHSFNATTIYSLPYGKGKRFGSDVRRVVDTLLGGWDIGALTILQTGQPFSVFSTRATTAVSGSTSPSNAYAVYSGTDRKIGVVEKRGSGVFFFTPEEVARFSFPGAGEIGNAGRNVFRNPSFFNIDASLVKRFRITERQALAFRAEGYNIFNHPNFGFPIANPTTAAASLGGLNLNNAATFGKFNSTIGTQLGSSNRTLQLVLRYDF